jgi:hypothetical protein
VAVAVDKPHHQLPPYTADCQLATTQNDRNDLLNTLHPLPHCHCHSLSHYHYKTAKKKTATATHCKTATSPTVAVSIYPDYQLITTQNDRNDTLYTAMPLPPSHCHSLSHYHCQTAKKKNSHSHPPALALVVEPVDPVDARALVVPAQKEKVLGILDLVPANPG